MEITSFSVGYQRIAIYQAMKEQTKQQSKEANSQPLIFFS